MTPTRKIGIGAFLLGSIVGGAFGVSGLASAASDDSSTTATVTDDGSSTTGDTTDASTDASTDAPPLPAGPHEANGITEEELTGDAASSVEAAVLAAYPDATIERMETDAEGAAYEAHITLADGSRATVELDAAFTITGTETGPAGGCGGEGHGPMGAPDDATSSADDTTSTADAATAA